MGPCLSSQAEAQPARQTEAQPARQAEEPKAIKTANEDILLMILDRHGGNIRAKKSRGLHGYAGAAGERPGFDLVATNRTRYTGI